MKLGRCSGTNKDGTACSAQARPNRSWCAWHDPDLAADRATWRQKGGAGRSNQARAKKALGDAGDLAAVQSRLVAALDKVEDGTLARERMAAVERILTNRGAS